MIPTLLLLATLCLPPGIPSPETMILIDAQVVTMEGQRPTEHFMIVKRLYQAPDGARYAIGRLLGAIAFVDDDPMNSDALTWWIDPGLVTDDVPPKAQAVPTSTCQWRRRADQT